MRQGERLGPTKRDWLPTRAAATLALLPTPSRVWRLPREAMWFFVCAPPVLALLFDPNCARTVDNVGRAWLALTLFTLVTGVTVHLVFEQVAKRTTAWPLAARYLVHAVSTAAVVVALSYLLHGAVRAVYPAVDDDPPAMAWRGVLVSYGYLAIARFIALLQERAAEERDRAHVERAAALEARLLALTAQLQPHFLFNSLNVCAGLVHTSPETAETMLDELAALLRYAVESGERRVVPLSAELGATRAYLAIQAGRFGERLRHEVIGPEPDGFAPLLPPMSLQPLVENAVQHGLADEEGGVVRVTCSREGARYLIAVEDTGRASPPSDASSTGIGQRNVRDRLRLVYGDDATLTCGPLPGRGYRSLISIPVEAHS